MGIETIELFERVGLALLQAGAVRAEPPGADDVDPYCSDAFSQEFEPPMAEGVEVAPVIDHQSDGNGIVRGLRRLLRLAL